MDRENGHERRVYVEHASPCESFRLSVTKCLGQIADVAYVLTLETVLRCTRAVERNNAVVAISESFVVHPCKVGDIDETFYLSSWRSLHRNRRAGYLLKTCVVPLGECRNLRQAIDRVQASPDKAVSLYGRKDRRTKPIRGHHTGLCWDPSALAIRCKSQPVIGTDDFIVLYPAHAQWNPAMRAQVTRYNDPVTRAVDNQFNVQQLRLDRLLTQVFRSRDREPVSRKNFPVALGITTFPRSREPSPIGRVAACARRQSGNLSHRHSPRKLMRKALPSGSR